MSPNDPQVTSATQGFRLHLVIRGLEHGSVVHFFHKRLSFDALPPDGLVLVHDFMVDDVREHPAFAAWYLLGSVFDNPNAVCLTPSYVGGTLKQAGFRVEGTEAMLAGITMLTRALKPV